MISELCLSVDTAKRTTIQSGMGRGTGAFHRPSFPQLQKKGVVRPRAEHNKGETLLYTREPFANEGFLYKQSMQQMPFHPESMTTGTNYFRALPEMSLVYNRLSLFFNCAPLLLQQLQSTSSRHYGPRPNVCRPAHIPNIPPSSDTCSDTIPPKSQPGLLFLLQKPPSHLLGPFFCIP